MSDAPSSFYVVIPARFGSTRFPGKPLERLGSKCVLQHVFDHARESGAADVLIATDDQRIRAAACDFGASVVMTDTQHQSGTDRIGEVATARGWKPETVVVNLQGDEPFVPSSLISTVAATLQESTDAGVATLARPLTDLHEVTSPNVVKVVTDHAGSALYFSRAPIPFPRGHELSNTDVMPPGVAYLGHLGIYAYRVEALHRLCAASPSPLETAESLEQLRALQLGIPIQVRVVKAHLGPGIDTPEDLERARQMIADDGTFRS